ncbi:MAG: glycosyltransferase family 2 protein [Lactobacillus gallinarum]|uniref:glycosyltransferase family 2 protein n=1 Tax=Lactobacillus gallinarum TaxID=52242 RepID=UPI003802BA5D
MSNKLISVIIPIFNAEETLKKCIESIINQSIHDYKIYLINDGSTDNTENILSKYNEEKNIRIINKNNEGASETRNFALKLVDTPFVVFMDADDYVEKTYLEHLIYAIKDHNADMAVTGIIRKTKKEENITKFKEKTLASKEMITEILKENGPGGYLWNKIFNTNVIKKYNIRFDPNINMAEDLLFCVQYLLHSKKVFISKECDYHYVQLNGSLSSGVSIFNTNRNYKKAYLDYIMSLQKIKSILPPDLTISRKLINERLCHISCDFLRTMKLNHSKDYKLYSKIRNIAINNRKLTLRSNNLTRKQKLYLNLVIWFPNGIYFLDKIRFR